ncbi:MAG: polysaccharide deacetylase family protein [Pyrinomonadaceae bacterium]|nr:polysaccharide deacetylase family protein [Acidobacteriota bacterium]MBP7376428.1 polysaccharide deacetylase family protein [Pyrinomonadaceae bacterium]
MKAVLLLLLTSLAVAAQAQLQTVAVTIDDLPVVSTRGDLKNRRQITKKLLGHIKKAKVPAIGFVNENKLYAKDKRDEKQIDLLRQWIDAGLELGNHTFSHPSLNRIELAEYEADLLKGETITKDLLRSKGREMRYFRHPFLQTGRTMEIKEKFDAFLLEHGYTVAPITFDNADYIFSRAYDIAYDRKDKKLMKQVGDAYVPYMEAKLDYWERQSVKLFGREVSQTLLIHANFINSDYFDDLAVMFVRRGYKFIDLETALKDDAYKLPDTFIGGAGISWLHRWALGRGKGNVLSDEPTVPDFVLKLSGFESE